MKKIILSVLLVSVLSLSLFAAVDPAELKLKTAITSDASLKFTSDQAGATTITEKEVATAATDVFVSYTSNTLDRAAVSLSATKIASPTVKSKIGYTIAVEGGTATAFTGEALDINELYTAKQLTTKTTEVKRLTIDVDDTDFANALSATDYVGTVTVTVKTV